MFAQIFHNFRLCLPQLAEKSCPLHSNCCTWEMHGTFGVRFKSQTLIIFEIHNIEYDIQSKKYDIHSIEYDINSIEYDIQSKEYEAKQYRIWYTQYRIEKRWKLSIYHTIFSNCKDFEGISSPKAVWAVRFMSYIRDRCNRKLVRLAHS